MRSVALYVPSHADLAEHPKLRRLTKTLGITRVCAVGHLHLLWHWTLRYAANGDLTPFTDDEVAEAAEWPGDAEQFINALVDSGWLDEEQDAQGQGISLRVHEWSEYAGRMERSRTSTRDRVRRHRARKAADGAVTVTPPNSFPVNEPPKSHRNPRDTENGADADAHEISVSGDVTVTQRLRNADVTQDIEKRREEKRERKRGDARVNATLHPDAPRLAAQLRDGLLKLKPDLKAPSMERWTRDADGILRIDGRSYEAASAVVRYVTGQTRIRDQWWVGRVLSMEKLREKFDAIDLAMQRGGQDGRDGRPLRAVPQQKAAGGENYEWAVIRASGDEAYWDSVGGRDDDDKQ